MLRRERADSLRLTQLHEEALRSAQHQLFPLFVLWFDRERVWRLEQSVFLFLLGHRERKPGSVRGLHRVLRAPTMRVLRMTRFRPVDT